MGLANKIPVPNETGNRENRPLDHLGIYLHVPFCSHACDFCAFYQVEPRREDIDRYLDAIEREMDLVERERCDTAFWGGGTPGLLPARDLARLARVQTERFGVPREWSVELAPSSVREEKLAVLREAGVTRVSLGVQSFSPVMLEALGRRHSLAQVREAWRRIEGAGFASRNIDLIFAVPGQSVEQWRADLEEAAAWGADHISTYCLTFEEDTALFVRLSEGKVRLDSERDRVFYQRTWEWLGALGYEQYEISNHCRPGHICEHNVNTWRMGRWHGFGPSAASQHCAGRGSNVADLALWAEAVGRGERACEERVMLAGSQWVEDALIFGLRMNAGVDLAELRARAGEQAWEPFAAALEAMQGDGLIERRSGQVVALTPAGRLVADAVGGELLGLGGAGK